jgi:hypothetical protein
VAYLEFGMFTEDLEVRLVEVGPLGHRSQSASSGRFDTFAIHSGWARFVIRRNAEDRSAPRTAWPTWPAPLSDPRPTVCASRSQVSRWRAPVASDSRLPARQLADDLTDLTA